jgi:RNA polymerase sigma factor for flagellar operon FliA
MPRAPHTRPPRLVAKLEATHFQTLGPALRTLTAAEQIARNRTITEAAIAARAGVSLATVKSHLTRLRAGGFVRTRRLAHGLVIDIAPSPARLFGVGNRLPGGREHGRLRGSSIVGSQLNGTAPLHDTPAAHAAQLGVASATPQVAPAALAARPGAASAREALILEHQALVRRVARHCAKSLPYWLEEDDLVSAGQLGLIEAADKYDPARGIPFAGFAYLLIRGRIIDANRRRNYDWELHDRLEGSDTGGQAELGREPSEIDERIHRQQLRAILDSAIAGLDERERLACATYLDEEGTLRQLGAKLGMTESGACLVRNKARARLREVLAEMGFGEGDLD